MFQLGRVLRLFDQPGRAGATTRGSGYRLERDIPPEPSIASPINFCHPAAANLFHNLVPREANTRRQARRMGDVVPQTGGERGCSRCLAEAPRSLVASEERLDLLECRRIAGTGTGDKRLSALFGKLDCGEKHGFHAIPLVVGR